MLEPELKEEIERLEGFNKYNVLVGKLRAFRFVQDIDEDERDTRLKGTPKCLIGRIFADFKDMYSPNGNLLKPFKVPTDWPIVAMIDWHPSERQAISFMGVDTIGNDYQFGEVWEHLGNEEIADEVIRRKKQGWRITKAYMDRLSKGDNSYNQNRLGRQKSSFDIVAERLRRAGIQLLEQSRAKDSGVKIIKTKLSRPNKIPVFFLFDTCQRTRYEVKRYVYEDGAYPDKDDHFMQNWYAYANLGLKYTPVQDTKPHYHTEVAGVA